MFDRVQNVNMSMDLYHQFQTAVTFADLTPIIHIYKFIHKFIYQYISLERSNNAPVKKDLMKVIF